MDVDHFSCHPPRLDLVRETLEGTLLEYNTSNAVMDLVLFDEVSGLDANVTASRYVVHVRTLGVPHTEKNCLNN